MSALDVFLISISAFYIIRGLFKGLSGELISLFGTIGSFYCSLNYYAPLSGFLSKKFGVVPMLSTALAMICLFCTVFVTCTLVGMFFKKILKVTKLKIVDKILGGLSGALRVYIITIVLLIVGMILSPFAGDKWVTNSKVLGAAAKTWPTVYPALDSMGLIPDMQSIQKNAQEYILKQAVRQIMPETKDKGDEETESGEKSSGIWGSLFGGTTKTSKEKSDENSRKQTLKSLDIKQ